MADEQSTVSTRVFVLIRQAKEWYNNYDASRRAAVVALAVKAIDDDPHPDVVGFECPACGSKGAASGDLIEKHEGGIDSTPDANVFRRTTILFTLSRRFHCYVCSLDLPDEDLLREAGIPLEIENEAMTNTGLELEVLLANGYRPSVVPTP